jgi:hypothetical protein
MVDSTSKPKTIDTPDPAPRRAALSAPLAALLPVKPNAAGKTAIQGNEAPPPAGE